MKLYISHGARRSDDPDDVDWFVVKPMPGDTETSVAGTPITNNMAVTSLIRAGREVYELELPDPDVSGDYPTCRRITP